MTNNSTETAASSEVTPISKPNGAASKAFPVEFPRATPSIAKIAKKIVDVCKDVTYIQKDKKNSFHGYTYASESAIKEKLHEAFAKHGLMMLPPEILEITDGEKDEKKRFLTTIKIRLGITDPDSGETVYGTLYGRGMDNEDKGIYKAITGALKYFLTTTFLIPTGDDPEDDPRDQPKQAPATAAGAPRQAAPPAPAARPAATASPRPAVAPPAPRPAPAPAPSKPAPVAAAPPQPTPVTAPAPVAAPPPTPAPAPAATPVPVSAEVSTDPPPPCSECGCVIGSFMSPKTKRVYTPEELVLQSMKTFNRPICAPCMRNMAAAANNTAVPAA